MEDMLPEIKTLAAGLAQLLQEHKGQNVSLLDMYEAAASYGVANWTDFFIIATVSSTAHMNGLERHLKDYCREKEIAVFGSSRKNTDDQWRLLDLGSIIIHLMTADAREFYDLERLWRSLKHA